MTLTTHTLDELEPAPTDLVGDLPAADYAFAPSTVEEAARVLAAATDERAPVLLWGGGTHQGMGHPVDAEVVLSTARLDRVLAWEPDDLTLVVEAGVRVAEVEQMLAEQGQTAGLPENAGEATVGGVVAAGISGYRRARYGPTRDRMLEVTLVTGDGRTVRGGGRVVKNVSGYDLPRLAAGSFGSIGLVAAVCLKLWPRPPGRATVRVEDPVAAWRQLHRPLAVLQTEGGAFAYLEGTPADIEAQVRRLGGDASGDLDWPAPPSGEVIVSLRVPPARLREAVSRLPAGWAFVAQHGVGEVTAAGDALDLEWAEDTRRWAEQAGGSLVLVAAPGEVYHRFDPWGSPPPALDLQRRITAAFDPARILNRGRLPGGRS